MRISLPFYICFWLAIKGFVRGADSDSLVQLVNMEISCILNWFFLIELVVFFNGG